MVKWSTTHRSIVMLISFFTLLAGMLLYGGMERQENPSVSSPVAIIKCIYPGGSPEDIEKAIIKPLEEKIGEISDIKRTDSYAMDSIGVIKVKLKDMSDDKIEAKWDELKEEVEKAQSQLPAEAYKAEVDTDFTDPYGVLIALSATEYSNQDLKDVAEKLKEELEKDPGVRSVDLYGDLDEIVEVNIDMQKVQQYGISPITMVKAMKARNVSIPSGNLELSNIKVPIHVTGEYNSIEEIENTILGVSKSGTPVYLRNVAQIGKKEIKAESLALLNEDPAVIVGIKYAEKENMVKIKERLDKTIDKFKKQELYNNMKLEVITDQASFVKTAIKLFEENLISAIALVVVVVWLSMGTRSAFVVSSSIPIIIAIVFIYMKLKGIPLHQVSIASLIISLSLLVANGIVANDSIYLYMEKGYDKKTACINGVNEVKIPILTSTLTTIASFLPLAMMVGSAGKFVSTLPILVSVSLIGSLITSLTLVPAMGYTFLKINPKHEKKEWFEHEKLQKYQKLQEYGKFLSLSKLTAKFNEMYKNTLLASLNKPKTVVSIAAIALVLSGMLIPSLGVQLFPPVERDQYYIDISVQDGSTTENTSNVVKDVVKVLEEHESVDSVLSMVGDGMPQYYITFTSNNKSSNKAQLIVNGSQSEINAIQDEIERKVPGAKANIRRLELAMPVDYPAQVRISGPDIKVLQELSDEIKGMMRTIPGSKNIDDNYGLESYKLNIKVNEEKANMVGLTNYDIASTVRMAINGLEVTKFKQDDIDEDDIAVVMRVPEAEKNSSEVLDEMFFNSTITGKNVSLRDIAKIEKESSLNKISRKDGKRTITVGMFMKDGYNSEQGLEVLQEKMADFELPNGYTMEFGGDSEERNDAFTSMIIPSILAVAMIYLVLVMQFGDLREPFIIMGTIPLSFIGIIWGLKLTGYPIGFMALLGAISLMGVVVNNGIILLDYIKLLNTDEADLKEAIAEACSIKTRPIMIGMITTVISLIPLAISGGALWAPMATAIIAGMIISSFLTLYIIPCSYVLVESKTSMLRKFNEFLRSR